MVRDGATQKGSKPLRPKETISGSWERLVLKLRWDLSFIGFLRAPNCSVNKFNCHFPSLSISCGTGGKISA